MLLAFSCRAGEQASNLAEDILLGDDFIRQLMSVGEVDLLIGIPSYNNAVTIAQTVRAIEESAPEFCQRPGRNSECRRGIHR